MFSWLRKGETAPELAPKVDLDAVAQQELAVLFKHSRTCHISWAAQREVVRFAAAHPEIPVHTVVVQEDRELSRRIEQWTGITHQSPQVIILRKGAVVTSDSHEGVTADFLAASVTAS